MEYLPSELKNILTKIQLIDGFKATNDPIYLSPLYVIIQSPNIETLTETKEKEYFSFQ